MQPNAHSRPARTCRAFVQRISAAVFLLFAALISRADNVTYPVTNSMTGTLDTNSITLQTVTFVDAGGTVHTAGFPTILTPSNGVMCVWSNMPSGLWLARSKFFANTWFNSQFQQGEFMGPGQPATPQGILFWVGNSTNTYPFTQYPLSNGHDGYNAFTFNSGIYGASLSGGFTGGVTNGVLYLNGSGFTPVLNPANITNGLGYIPANTNTVISTITPTNGPIAVTLAGQTLFVGADTNTAGTVAANQATNKLSQSAYEPTNIFDLAGAATSAANQSTNLLQQSAYEPTNVFDLAGSANAASKAATNNMGVGSQLSAFVNTNQFDAAGAAAAGTNALLGAIGNTNTAIQNLMAYDRAKINCNQQYIMVSGGTGSYASLNGTNVQIGTSQSWTNINNLGAVSSIGVYSVSAVNVAQTTSGYPVGTLTAITGSGTLPTVSFATNGIQAGANVTVSQVQGNFIISSTGGSGSASSNSFSGQLNIGQIFPAADTNGAGTQAANYATNLLQQSAYEPTNIFDLAGAGTTAANRATNLLQQSAYEPTNTFDLAGSGIQAANQATNKLAQSAYVPTNTFDMNGSATSAANQSTNILGKAAWQNTNFFDLAGAANSAANQATNSMGLASQTAAFANTNQFDGSGSANNTWKTNNPNAFPNITAPSETLNISALTAANSTIGSATITTMNGAVTLASGFTFKDSGNSFGALGNILGDLGGGILGYTNFFAGTSSNSILFNGQPTNSFDVYGAGTNAANQATNKLAQSAYEPTNTFDLAGAAVSAATIVTNQVAPTNSPTIWSLTLHNVTSLGGNLWSTETNGVLGLTNWPAVNGFVNATLSRSSANTWGCTNANLLWLTASSNGTTVSIISNHVTISTATALTGPYTMQSPGSGTPGGVYIGNQQNDIGVEILSPTMRDAVFENPPQDSSGTYPVSTNIATLSGGNIGGTFTGTVIGNGAGLTNVNAINGSGFWVSNNLYGAVGGRVFSAAGPGDALQACLNLMFTNGQYWASGSTGLGGPPQPTLTTNILGGKLHIYSFSQPQSGICCYYRPQGFYISNEYSFSGLTIEGDNPYTTVIAGDSNVFSFPPNLNFSENLAGFAKIQDIGFAWSNFTAKAVACDWQAECPIIGEDLLFNWLGNFAYSNNINSLGSAAPTMNDPVGPTTQLAIVGLGVGGAADAARLDNVFIAGCACGVIVEQDHVMMTNVRLPGGGGTINSATNGYSTNDISSPLPNYSVRACELALGPGILLDDNQSAGSEDVLIEHTKIQGWNTGILILDGAYEYGPTKIIDPHFEVVPHDIVFGFSTNRWKGNQSITATIRDGFSQDTPNYCPQMWEYNGTNFLLSTNFSTFAGFGAPYEWDEGVYWTGAYSQMQIHSNNIVREAF